mgnify:CR=1 FL=1
MGIAEIKKKLSEYIQKPDKRKIIVFVGLMGIFLILISELIPKENKETQQETVRGDDLTSEAYKQQLENELEEIISKIDGVGKASIMVTLDGTTEYVYAEELDSSTDNTDSSKRESLRSKIVITESGGDKKALVKKIIIPEVTGVLVACPGGDNIQVKEKVIGAVSAVLGIPAGRVYVVKISE